MKKICLCFQIHQPFRLKRYRFFDIGAEHYYYDTLQNDEILQRIAEQSYIPANRMLLELLRTYPDFRVSFVISGVAIEQMEVAQPDLLKSFQDLIDTGRVEMLATPYAYSLSSLNDPEEFKEQVRMQQSKLQELFGISPSKVLCNTELIYSDDIALMASELGMQGILTEGAKHILGWKSPNYLYNASSDPHMGLLLRNSSLTDLITRDFARYDSPEYPVTADKVLNRIKWLPEGEEFVNLYMNYEVLGSMHRAETGIFDFFRAIPALASSYDATFATPSELITTHKPVDTLIVNYPISGSGEEKSTNLWTGNVLQQGALEKLRLWRERIYSIRNRSLLQDWICLQSADHFYYMNTNISNGFSPYISAYDAFNNYMNVLSDFFIRAERLAPNNISTEHLNSYEEIIERQGKYIEELESKVAKLEAIATTKRSKKSLNEGEQIPTPRKRKATKKD